MNRQDFESDQEWYCYNWLLELQLYGFINNIRLQYPVFSLSDKVSIKLPKQLKTKVKYINKVLLSEIKYTPDFCFDVLIPIPGVIFPIEDLKHEDGMPLIPYFKGKRVILEAKPMHDYKNMTRHVKVKIGTIYQRYRELVTIVKVPDCYDIIDNIFSRTFTPQRVMEENMYVKDPNRCKLKYETRTINEFFKQLQDNPRFGCLD